jgi:response regulator of citrate/malate metabolism
MIRTLIVDDDFRVAAIHAAYVAKIDGFEVVAEAHTAAETVNAVDRLRPDLMLLDLYLPDEHGLKLVARLRDGHPPVDVIVITAAKDADSVRVAMQGGALHYLLKPFGFPVLRDKLLSYAQMRTRLSALRDADQRTVDRVFGALRAPDQLAGVKGRSVHTLEAVEQLLSETDEPPPSATSATCTRSAAWRSSSATAAAAARSTATGKAGKESSPAWMWQPRCNRHMAATSMWRRRGRASAARSKSAEAVTTAGSLPPSSR